MPYNVKEVVGNKPSRFTAGHRMCAGCGAPPVARHIMRALKPEDHAVVAGATGCMEVSTFIYPQLGQIHLSIQHLNVQLALYLVQKQHMFQ